MPTYEYECKSCSNSFEVFQAMSDLPLKECPKCGKDVRRLIFGGAGVIFKGSGFYVNDKSKATSAAAATPPVQKPEGCKGCTEAAKCPVTSEKAGEPKLA